MWFLSHLRNNPTRNGIVGYYPNDHDHFDPDSSYDPEEGQEDFIQHPSQSRFYNAVVDSESRISSSSTNTANNNQRPCSMIMTIQDPNQITEESSHYDNSHIELANQNHYEPSLSFSLLQQESEGPFVPSHLEQQQQQNVGTTGTIASRRSITHRIQEEEHPMIQRVHPQQQQLLLLHERNTITCNVFTLLLLFQFWIIWSETQTMLSAIVLSLLSLMVIIIHYQVTKNRQDDHPNQDYNPEQDYNNDSHPIILTPEEQEQSVLSLLASTSSPPTTTTTTAAAATTVRGNRTRARTSTASTTATTTTTATTNTTGIESFNSTEDTLEQGHRNTNPSNDINNNNSDNSNTTSTTTRRRQQQQQERRPSSTRGGVMTSTLDELFHHMTHYGLTNNYNQNNNHNNGNTHENVQQHHIDLSMLPYQAQLAYAIMESQRYILETGGYGRPDGPEDKQGVRSETIEKWKTFRYNPMIGGDIHVSHDITASSSSSMNNILSQMKSMDKESPTCCICLSEYETNEELKEITPCGHWYHSMCILEWVKHHTTCPLCQVDLEDCRPT